MHINMGQNNFNMCFIFQTIQKNKQTNERTNEKKHASSRARAHIQIQLKQMSCVIDFAYTVA